MGNIVVTGMGIISALGAGKEATLRMLMAGERAIAPIRHLQTRHKDLPVGEVPYSDEELRTLIGFPEDRIITRTSLLGRVALREALDDACLTDAADRKRIAFISGNTVGGMEKSERYYHDFRTSEEHKEYIAMHDCGACTDLIAEEYAGKFSLITTISTACSSAANAIILGADLIRSGQVDMAVVGGTECLSAFHLNGFHTLMILDPQPCRPFDAERHGLNLGEGAAYIVIESAESACERNVKPLCVLSGYGNACDAYHQTATSPNGEGPFLAMRQALEQSGLQPSDIDYINAHGTGTGNNDECEGIAMMRIFGDTVPPVSSTKSYTGHTTSAAGGVESVISILALQHQFIPANLGFQHAIGKHNFRPVDHVIQPVGLRHVLTNSFGFGGNDSSCIFSIPKKAATGIPFPETSPCYIQSVAQISIQQPLCDDWFDIPVPHTQPYNESIDPDYKNHFPPMVARRLGKLLKRAIVTAKQALGETVPEAIITGTGLGCIENTEKFLVSMLENDEEYLQPTYFMQSTHNTISSQVALQLQCHGYNCTYSHRGTSFDSGLLDALTQIRHGRIRNALVGGQEEMTPAYFEMLGKIGYWRNDDISPDALRASDRQGSFSGSCSLNMLLTSQRDGNTLCAIRDMRMLYQPSDNEMRNILEEMLNHAGITLSDVDAVVMGISGDNDNDLVCKDFHQKFCPNIPIVWYKHLFGESFCASAFGLYAGAVCLHRGRIPEHLLYHSALEIQNPRNILVFNHFKNKDQSLTLLSK